MEKIKRERKIYSRKTKHIIFYALIMSIPVANFLVFYVWQNMSAIFLAFEHYELPAGDGIGYIKTFVFADNFKNVIDMLNGGNWHYVLNSLKLFLWRLLVGIPLAVIFSFFIYKKFRGAGFFKIILFMPSIISSVVLVIIYRWIVSDVYTTITGAERGLLTSDPWNTVLLFTIFTGFGTSVLMYSGAMNGINDSIVESAKLDGANYVTEFWYITLPMIWPTLTTFLVVALSNVFIDGMNIYTFFARDGHAIGTMGYYLYFMSLEADLIPSTVSGRGYEFLTYSEISAFGIMITAVVLPVVLLVKKLCEKFGPGTE